MKKKYSKHTKKFRMVVNYFRIACQAVDRSLQHWVDNFNGKTSTYRAKDCPLCGIFYSHNNCGACPVALYVRDFQKKELPAWNSCYCSLTPWLAVSIHGGGFHDDCLRAKKCTECKKLAGREYKFLLKVRRYYWAVARESIRAELLRGWEEEERELAVKKRGKK